MISQPLVWVLERIGWRSASINSSSVMQCLHSNKRGANTQCTFSNLHCIAVMKTRTCFLTLLDIAAPVRCAWKQRYARSFEITVSRVTGTGDHVPLRKMLVPARDFYSLILTI